MHGGRRRRPPGVARDVDVDDQIAEGSRRQGDRIAQHRRPRLDRDRRVAAEGQVGARLDRAVVAPRGHVGGADLEGLGAEQVRQGHPHLRPADARPDHLPDGLVPHANRRARRRRGHLFRLHLGRRRLDRDGPCRPRAHPAALRRRHGGNRNNDRGDGHQRERQEAPARGASDRARGPAEPGNPVHRHPAIQSAWAARGEAAPVAPAAPRSRWRLSIVPSCPRATATEPAGKRCGPGPCIRMRPHPRTRTSLELRLPTALAPASLVGRSSRPATAPASSDDVRRPTAPMPDRPHPLTAPAHGFLGAHQSAPIRRHPASPPRRTTLRRHVSLNSCHRAGRARPRARATGCGHIRAPQPRQSAGRARTRARAPGCGHIRAPQPRQSAGRARTGARAPGCGHIRAPQP